MIQGFFDPKKKEAMMERVKKGLPPPDFSDRKPAPEQNISAVQKPANRRTKPHNTQWHLDKELIRAAQHGDANKIEELLKKGANANARNSSRVTPLAYAVMTNIISVELLLGANASPNGYVSKYGETILMRAAKAGHVDVVNSLCNLSADINAETKPYHLSDKNLYTALDYAASYGRPDVVKYLIQRGAGAMVGKELWSRVLRHAAQSGCVDIMRIMLEKGADINEVCPTLDKSPLMIVASGGKGDAVDFLLKNGAAPNVVNSSGYTAYSYAMKNNHLDIAAVLKRAMEEAKK